MTETNLREKLRLIRDSDHPASPWARNVVQCLDEMKASPNDPVLLRQLGKNVAMFERRMSIVESLRQPQLTSHEIAAIFGLGGQPSDPQ